MERIYLTKTTRGKEEVMSTDRDKRHETGAVWVSKYGEEKTLADYRREAEQRKAKRKQLAEEKAKKEGYVKSKKRRMTYTERMNKIQEVYNYWKKNPDATYKMIAEEMDLTEQTVSNYLRKYGITSKRYRKHL